MTWLIPFLFAAGLLMATVTNIVRQRPPTIKEDLQTFLFLALCVVMAAFGSAVGLLSMSVKSLFAMAGILAAPGAGILTADVIAKETRKALANTVS